MVGYMVNCKTVALRRALDYDLGVEAPKNQQIGDYWSLCAGGDR